MRHSAQKNILLMRKMIQFAFFFVKLTIMFNKEYFLDNNLKVYLLQIF